MCFSESITILDNFPKNIKVSVRSLRPHQSIPHSLRVEVVNKIQIKKLGLKQYEILMNSIVVWSVVTASVQVALRPTFSGFSAVTDGLKKQENRTEPRENDRTRRIKRKMLPWR